MKTAEVALLVSIFSVLLSVASLGWNIRTFAQSGPKVKVSLEMGTQERRSEDADTRTSTVAVSAKKWAETPSLHSLAGQSFFLKATNTGRAAIYVDSIGLCSATASITVNIQTDVGENNFGFGPSLPVKLEAGQTVRWAIRTTFASSLWSFGEASETDCIHGHIALGNGATKRTDEGVRIGLLKASVDNSQSD